MGCTARMPADCGQCHVRLHRIQCAANASRPPVQSCGGAPFLRTVCVVVASLVPLSTHQLRACRHSGLTLWPYPIQTKSKMTGEKVEIPPAVRKDMADLFAQIDEDNGGTVRACRCGQSQ